MSSFKGKLVIIVLLVFFTGVLVGVLGVFLGQTMLLASLPKTEVTNMESVYSNDNRFLYFHVTISNKGGAGWVRVYAEVSGEGVYEKQDQRIFLESGELRELSFTFNVTWNGTPIYCRAWAVAD